MPLATLISYLAICQGEGLSAACMIDSWAFYWTHFFFLKGQVGVKASVSHMAAVSHPGSRNQQGTPGA